MRVNIEVNDARRRIEVQSPYALSDICRSVPGGRWDPKSKVWHYALTPATAKNLRGAFVHPKCDIEVPVGSDAVIFHDPGGEREITVGPGVMSLCQIASVGEMIKGGPPDLDPIPETKMQPWSNQLIGYHLIAEQPATLLAWEMGTGKTKTVIDYICNRHPMLTLILCPTAVLPVWEHQFTIHQTSPVKVIVLLPGPSVEDRAEWAADEIGKSLWREVPIVLVINYEAAWRAAFAKFALKQEWDLVVCDEIHRIKSPSGKASRFCQRLATRSRKRVGLTGTPMPHSPLDVYGYFRFLDAGIFGTSFVRFRGTYAVMGGYQNHQVMSYQNTRELHQKFFTISHKVVKEEVLDLPEAVHEERVILMPTAAEKVYWTLEQEFIADVGSGVVTAANALAKLIRLAQITSGFMVVDKSHPDGFGYQVIEQLHQAKADDLRDLLSDLPVDEPMVVFCRFIRDIETVHEVAASLDRESVELSGRRHDIQALWEDGPETVAAIQMQAGGEGIDLTRSRYAYYYSIGFRGGLYLQTLSRLHRQGQDRKVTYFHAIARDTVDAKVHKVLADRRRLIDDILKPDAPDSTLKEVLALYKKGGS